MTLNVYQVHFVGNDLAGLYSGSKIILAESEQTIKNKYTVESSDLSISKIKIDEIKLIGPVDDVIYNRS